jgi:hypothetical protein
MAAHRITEELLDTSPEDTEAIGEADQPLYSAGRIPLWRRTLARTIAALNGCHVLTRAQWSNADGKRSNYRNNIVVFGRPSDTATVRYLFDYLTTEIERLRKRHIGKGRTWAESFRAGAIDQIKAKMRRAQQEARDDARAKARRESVALVKIDEALARIDERHRQAQQWVDENMNPRAGRKYRVSRDYRAYQQGRNEAREIRIPNGSAAALTSEQTAVSDGE